MGNLYNRIAELCEKEKVNSIRCGDQTVRHTWGLDRLDERIEIGYRSYSYCLYPDGAITLGDRCSPGATSPSAEEQREIIRQLRRSLSLRNRQIRDLRRNLRK